MAGRGRPKKEKPQPTPQPAELAPGLPNPKAGRPPGSKLGSADTRYDGLQGPVVKRILQAVELGMTFVHAAGYGGVAESTLHQWRHDYEEFAEAVIQARSRAIAGRLFTIRKAESEGNWQAAAWWLERMYPQDYGRTVAEHRLTGPDGGPIQTEAKVETSVRLRQLDELAERIGANGIKTLMQLRDLLAAGDGPSEIDSTGA